jgi:hypothetical protein
MRCAMRCAMRCVCGVNEVCMGCVWVRRYVRVFKVQHIHTRR